MSTPRLAARPAAARRAGARPLFITPDPGQTFTQHLVASPAAKLQKSVGLIRSKIIKGAQTGQARPLAMQILRKAKVPPRDARGEIRALATFMQNVAPYRSDIWGVETVADLADTIQNGGADCDCYTVAIGQLGMSAGYPVRLKVVGNAARPSHIYPEFYDKRSRSWIPADATKPGDPTNINRTWNTVITIPIDPWMRDEDFSSWLSEVTKKVLGKKTGKAIEKAVNTIGKTVVQTASAVAGILPGGSAISKAIDTAYMLRYVGADPAKIGAANVEEIRLQNPAMAAQMDVIRASGQPGWTMSASGMRYDPLPGQMAALNIGPDGQAYTDAGQLVDPATVAALMGTSGLKSMSPGVYGSAAAAPASSLTSLLPILALVGVGALLYFKK